VGSTYLDGGPDLVVEVFSPSTRRCDLVQKPALYATAGVREYWQVDPDARSLVINILVVGRYRAAPPDGNVVRSVVLEGLEVDIPGLFEG
jgi:Uma2 family endonuclease